MLGLGLVSRERRNSDDEDKRYEGALERHATGTATLFSDNWRHTTIGDDRLAG
jgi:hypothetical protein